MAKGRPCWWLSSGWASPSLISLPNNHPTCLEAPSCPRADAHQPGDTIRPPEHLPTPSKLPSAHHPHSMATQQEHPPPQPSSQLYQAAKHEKLQKKAKLPLPSITSSTGGQQQQREESRLESRVGCCTRRLKEVYKSSFIVLFPSFKT